MDTFSIASAGPPSVDGPEPAGLGDRLFLRQVYETLVRIDCAGRVEPGLATGWTSDSNGRTWTFTLDRGAEFPDGTPVDAFAIRSSWERASQGSWPWLGIEGPEVLGPHRLRVRLSTPTAELPLFFADLELAVKGPPRSGGQAAESGAFLIVNGSPERGLLELKPRRPNGGRVLRFPSPAGLADPRDALDFGPGDARRVDVLVTRDPATLAYAAGRSDLRSVPLAWDRTYFLVSPILGSGAGFSPEGRRALARDAVRGDARGAEPPFWMASDSTCPALSGHRRGLPRLAYPNDDPTARGLAERLVALAVAPDRPAWLAELAGPGGRPDSLRAIGVDRLTLAAWLAAGQAAAVVAYPRMLPAGCTGPLRGPGRGTVIPLIDSRAHAIVRRGTPGFTILLDGTIRFEPGPAR